MVVGEREGELGADFTFISMPRVVKSAPALLGCLTTPVSSSALAYLSVLSVYQQDAHRVLLVNG
jgi:hypothetical protein